MSSQVKTMKDALGAVPETPIEDYHVQWRIYRVRFWSAVTLLVLWPVVAVEAFLVSRNGLHMPILALAVILGWLGLAVAAVWWAGEFRCPRCRRRYGALGQGHKGHVLTRGLFTKVCQNCRLKKFEYS